MILIRLRPTFKIMPIANKLVSMVLPPAVIKGSGKPVTGIIPNVMPTLISKWKKKMLVAPVASKAP